MNEVNYDRDEITDQWLLLFAVCHQRGGDVFTNCCPWLSRGTVTAHVKRRLRQLLLKVIIPRWDNTTGELWHTLVTVWRQTLYGMSYSTHGIKLKTTSYTITRCHHSPVHSIQQQLTQNHSISCVNYAQTMSNFSYYWLSTKTKAIKLFWTSFNIKIISCSKLFHENASRLMICCVFQTISIIKLRFDIVWIIIYSHLHWWKITPKGENIEPTAVN